MKEVKKAKEKAEGFLNRIVTQSWFNVFRIENDKLDTSEWIEWPLRFEAHAYLGNRHNELITNFAKELRSIWLNWKDWHEKGKLGKRRIFWPIVERYCIPIGDPDNADWELGFEIESHIAMFRAKEILGIKGFETYFNTAKKRLRYLLLEEDVFLNWEKRRIIWQIVRSSTLLLFLKDYIKIIASRIIEEDILKIYLENEVERLEAKKRRITTQGGDWAEAIFFLVLSNSEDKYNKLVIDILSKKIDDQEKNGSFNDEILTTCLYISSLYIMDLDPNRIICEEAIKWLLNRQNEDGSWEFWRLSSSKSLLEAKVFATVVVLETIDLITDSKPLPVWAEKAGLSVIYPRQKSFRIQPIVPFKTPEGINWKEISIIFVSEEVVQIRAGNNSEGRDFILMGFADRRRRLKEHTPDWSWMALKEFAKHQGEISLNDNDINLRIKRNLKSYVHVISIRLKKLFKMNENPFDPYNRKKRSWKTKFIVKDSIQE